MTFLDALFIFMFSCALHDFFITILRWRDHVCGWDDENDDV